jgi:predicted AlkP superfamily pyrophosphatase or phosphodiesterase
MADDFIKPRYDSGGFASLPKRITNLLTGPEKYEAVVLFLIDGFGWRFFEKFQDEPFIQRVNMQGGIEKLTSQFPSTTAAHLTTLHSGLPVGEHGIFEWMYYEPLLDAVIAPLPFSYSGTRERGTLLKTGVRPRTILPVSKLYHSLKKQGISSCIFEHREYSGDPYGNLLFTGAKTVGYKTLPEALVNLAEAVAVSHSPAYFVLYNEKVDSISHEYGPNSSQTTGEILSFLLTMEQIFLKAVKGCKKKVLFLLTADHGQVETDPETTIYINREPRFDGIKNFLKTDRKGSPIVPAGSARDFFLYIRDGMVDEALAFLTQRLEGQAEVRKVADLIAEDYFGPTISPKFPPRAGDLVILPYRGESVWWYEKDRFEQRFRGHHGGLTRQEIEIPLLRWEL